MFKRDSTTCSLYFSFTLDKFRIYAKRTLYQNLSWLEWKTLSCWSLWTAVLEQCWILGGFVLKIRLTCSCLPQLWLCSDFSQVVELIPLQEWVCKLHEAFFWPDIIVKGGLVQNETLRYLSLLSLTKGKKINFKPRKEIRILFYEKQRLWDVYF